MNHPLYIRKIWQKDNETFAIEWNDERVQDFRLCDVQRLCPCANCTDENTGKSRVDPGTVQEHVSAVAIRSVGRYGLQIQFTSGCSTGSYSFDRLRAMQKEAL
jgi:DUF971 family protein